MPKDKLLAYVNGLTGRITGNLFKEWIVEHKKAALVLGCLPVTVPLIYFADVWALGTTAAAIKDFQVHWNAISIFATPEQKAAADAHVNLWPWFFSHPFQVGWAWLTKPTEALSQPEIKHIWEWLNVFGGVFAGALFWKLKGGSKKNNSKFTKGLKNVDNTAFATSRWASRNDIKHLSEFGPPIITCERDESSWKL